MVQWLGLCASTVGGRGSIPGRGTKILQAALHGQKKRKKFIEKKLSLKLNCGRHVRGILWRSDSFMSPVVDECVEMVTSRQQKDTRMVVIRIVSSC